MILGICGGTFDPVHYGHLRPALEVMEALSPAEVVFVPNATPPHRETPGCSSTERLHMLRTAVAGQSGFYVDTRELEREGPSWTVDTLASLREEHATRSLCLMLGTDAFAGLPGWHRWRELLSLAHLVVMQRPGWTVPDTPELEQLLARCRARTIDELHAQPAGRIWLQDVTALDISATRIRSLAAQGRDLRYLLPDSVRDIICKEGFYGYGTGRGEY